MVVADDEPLMRFALRTLLESDEDIEVVGEAFEGAQVLDRVRELRPDVVLTDLLMPGMDGITAARQLRELPYAPAVLVLTTFDTEDGIARALAAGAKGYLLKDAPPEQVVAAVRLVASGATALASGPATRLATGSGAGAAPRPSLPDGSPFPDAPTPPESPSRLVEGLSTQQRRLLRHLVAGMSNAAIARSMHLSEGTVKAYVSRLMSVLEVDNRTQAAILGHRAGLTGAHEPPPCRNSGGPGPGSPAVR
ncbi:response regulator transcription factor [Streptomyces sp. G1]|uniref:response regulator transcription factor n=1 Tax=Streptomyces sp. G1 TaxID=361572 RepID=UPI00202E2588|nr:response regulator transcription factor [Streptomyces sp. G1]MCM1966365.1 response regulator transcription factor [Streptomyces sp. G1]